MNFFYLKIASLTLSFLVIKMNHCNAYANDHNSIGSISKIITAQNTLSSCSLSEDSAQTLLLKKIQNGFNNHCKSDKQTQEEKVIEKQIQSDSALEFVKNLWLQNMKELVTARVYSELKYKKTISTPDITPDVNQIVNEICAQSATETFNSNADRCRYSKLPDTKQTLIQVGNELVRSFKSSQIKVQTLDQVQLEVNSIIDTLHHSYIPVFKDDLELMKAWPIFGNARNEIKERKKRHLEEYEKIKSNSMSAGGGVLLRTSSLISFSDHSSHSPEKIIFNKSKYERVQLPSKKIHDPRLIEKALDDYKNAINSLAGEMNTNVAWAVGLDPKSTALGNPAWIGRIIIANPFAVGKLLEQHPEYAHHVCHFVQAIDGMESLNEKLELTLQGVAWVPMLVSGGGVLFELGALARLGLAAESSSAISKITTLKTVSNSIGKTLFTGSVSSHLVQFEHINSEIQKAERNLMVGTGVTDEDIKAKKQMLDQNNYAIITDIVSKFTPGVGNFFNLGNVTKNPATGKILKQLQETYRVKPRHLSASFELFTLACGMEEWCSLVLSAFQANSAVEQERILSSKKNIDEFIKMYSKDPRKI